MFSIRLFNNHLKTPFLCLAVIEAICFAASVYAAVYIRFYEMSWSEMDAAIDFDTLIVKALLFSLMMLLCMIAIGNYRLSQHIGYKRFADNLVRVGLAMVIGSVLLSIIYFAFPEIRLGRGVMLLALLCALLTITLLHNLMFGVIKGQSLQRRVLAFGAGENAANIHRQLSKQNDCGSCIVANVMLEGERVKVLPEKIRDELNIIQYDRSLKDICDLYHIDEIVVCMDDRRKHFPSQELIDCKLSGIHVIEPIEFLEREQGKLNLSYLNPSWMIFGDGYHRTCINNALGRIFDIVACMTILFFTWPVLVLVMALISLEGRFKEPIFYTQLRVGKDGHNFKLYKFRSMIQNAEKEGKAIWASANDPRITRVGAFMRKTRIDELPQIYNILKGDMRVVGPRPERPTFVAELADKIPYYNRRHAIKPGLAGWAQLKYPYGANEHDALQKLQYDLYYVKNNNIVMDFFILLQTAEIVIFGKGAR